MKNRNKYLAKNTALFALNTIGTKLITFFLVPIYTSVLTTGEYGTADLVSTIAMILVPLLTLNVGEAIMRFSLDEDADYASIMSTGILVAIISFFVSFSIIIICNNLQPLKEFKYYVFFYCIVQGWYQILVCYLRGKEKLVDYAICNIVHVFSTALFNILFLCVFKMGINGYFIAYIMGYLVGGLYAFFKGKIYKILKKFNFDITLTKKMLKYSIVLVPTSFMWWIMNSSDRIMVTAMVGVTANGIYAIAYKLPTVLSAMSTVFNQAWSYSAIKEKDSEDREEFHNKMFNRMVNFQFIITAMLLMIIKPFLKIYVSNSYYSAWKYSPALIVGFFFMSLGTFLSSLYTVHKDSKGFLFSGMSGAILNVIFNLILIPIWGVNGAAIATCISYIAVFFYRIFDTKKYISINYLNKNYILGIIILLLMSLSVFIEKTFGIIILILEFLLMLFISRKFIFECCLSIKKYIQK